MKHAEPTAADRLADEWDTFEIRLPRSPLVLRLFNRAPLVRSVDRVEAFVVALAFVVAVLAIPIAAAIGTAVHDARSAHYAGEANSRHSVTATVTRVPDLPPFSRTGMMPAPVEWWDDGTQRTALTQVRTTASAGDRVELWVNDAGEPVTAPASTSRAAVEGVTSAIGIWAGVVAAVAIVCAGAQLVCNRIRLAAWQHDLDHVAGNGGGHTTSHP